MASNNKLIKLENGNLTVQSYSNILKTLIAGYASIAGGAIDVSNVTPEGQELRFLASLFDDFGKTIQNVVSMFNIDNLEGSILDDFAVVTYGLTRHTATTNDSRTIADLTVQYTFATSAEAIAFQNAIGDYVDAKIMLSDSSKWLVTDASAVAVDTVVTVIFTISAWLSGEQLFDITLDVISFAKDYYSPLQLWDANSLSIVYSEIGITTETDEQFRTRIKQSSQQAGMMTVASLVTRLQNDMPFSVGNVKLINNNANTAKTVTIQATELAIPAHEVACLIKPAITTVLLDTDDTYIQFVKTSLTTKTEIIANAILQKMPLGISTFFPAVGTWSETNSWQTLTITANDALVTGIANWLIVKPVGIMIDIDLLTASGMQIATGTAAFTILSKQIASAIAAYATTFSIAEELTVAELRTVINSILATYANKYIISNVTVATATQTANDIKVVLTNTYWLPEYVTINGATYINDTNIG